MREGPVRSTSCLVTSPHWPTCAPLVRELEGADVGLHFALTTFPPSPGSRRGTARGLALRSLVGIDRGWVERALAWQWDRFLATLGRVPDFVDGHHHVHQFSGVREVVARFLERRAPGIAIRISASAPRPGLLDAKSAWLRSQAIRARRFFRKAGLACSERLFGIHATGDPAWLASIWSDAVRLSRTGDALMTHPGLDDDLDLPSVDDYVTLRGRELDLLTGRIARELAAVGVEPARLREVASRARCSEPLLTS